MNPLQERRRALGQHRPCDGGESSSQANNTTNNVDRRVTGRDGAQVSGDGNTVYVSSTDHEAVMRGVELAKGALALTGGVSATALDKVSAAYETARAGDQKMVKVAAVAVIGLAAVAALGKK